MRNYGISEECARRERLQSLFVSQFGRRPSLLFSSPKGVEFIGTLAEDHFGRGMCTAISRDLLCAADLRSDDRVEIKAEGFDGLSFSVHDLEHREREKGRLVSLTRGVLRYLKNNGYEFNGFSAFFQSDLIRDGSFFSAFSVLVAQIVNTYYLKNLLSPVRIALAGEYAENFTFGKCGSYSEHIAIVNGGCNVIDFGNKEQTAQLPFPEEYEFVLTDLSGIFNPSEQEIRLKKELSAVAASLGGETLGDIPFAAFADALPHVRRTLGDRAALCALHFYEENVRADSLSRALSEKNIPLFLGRIGESGEKEAELFKECAGGDAAMLALRLGGLLLKDGACRLNGSSVFAMARGDCRNAYMKEMIRLFGRDRVKLAQFRKSGCCAL